LLGIWRDFDDLESSLSLGELIAVLEAYRKKVHDDRKFMAAIQGIDIDKNQPPPPEHKSLMERVKARLGKEVSNKPDNDITNLKGKRARDLGFGIGMGIDYEVIGADGAVTT